MTGFAHYEAFEGRKKATEVQTRSPTTLPSSERLLSARRDIVNGLKGNKQTRRQEGTDARSRSSKNARLAGFDEGEWFG
uniref:Uncharacterized protein n=1 Tax=Steinernema glaseri TaxID=37863 RepID=A0A1I7ZG43_9BILA